MAMEGIKILSEERAFVRAQNNKLFQLCLKIISDSVFTFFVNLCIIVNTVTLAFDEYPIDPV